MKLNLVNGVYDEASTLYINAIVMRRKCSVSEAIEYIQNEENKSQTQINPSANSVSDEGAVRFRRALSEDNSRS